MDPTARDNGASGVTARIQEVLSRLMNYTNTFIAVAPDTSANVGSTPQACGGKKSIAALEYEPISAKLYTYTQEEVQFIVYVRRTGISDRELRGRRAELWREFFSKPIACMRTSPLPRSYGWGLHFNVQSKVALVAVESPEYKRLSSDPCIEQTRAMRRKRV